jgi:hypothetical protein
MNPRRRSRPWIAVAAATAFLALTLARRRYEAEAEGDSCCYRNPRRFAQAQTMTCHKWAGEGAPFKSQNVRQKNKKLRPGTADLDPLRVCGFQRFRSEKAAGPESRTCATLPGQLHSRSQERSSSQPVVGSK